MSRVKVTVLAILTIVLTASFVVNNDLEKKTLLNNKIELKVPKEFKVMSEDMMVIKYPSQNRPKLVYTNGTGGINVAVSLSQSEASQEMIPSFVDDFVAVFENAYPSADWKGKGVNTINGKEVGYLELVTPALDTKIYNLMFFTDLDGKLLICTFNCVKKSMGEWKSTAKEIMNSLKVN